LFGFGAQTIVGLDIGSSSVKLVEVVKKRSGFVMTNFDSVSLPEDSIIDGDIVNHSVVVEAVRAALKEINPKTKVVCTSVAGSSVIIKHITIDKVSPGEIEDSVYFEAEQYLPFSLEEITLDYEVVQEDMGDGKMEILLVAAKKDFINKRLSVIRDAGFEPTLVDIDAIALANVFWENYDLEPNTAALLLDIGASLTKINIISANTSLFTRDVAIGGKNLTLEIQNKMGVSFQEAEVLKLDAAASGQIPSEMQLFVSSICENISLEVRRSLDFYAAASLPYSVVSIYVSGGSSRIPGLVQSLEEMLGLPVQLLNPFVKISFSGKDFTEQFIAEQGPSAVIPLGLALRLGDA
jgi:type IV pilus assembly protein PilM